MNELTQASKTNVEPDFIFMSDVRPNNDTYTWQELNCFYRPFGIALQSFDSRFYDLFLMLSSLHINYIIGKARFVDVKSGYAFFDYYNDYLKDLFKAEINEIPFQTEEEMHALLQENLSANKIVIFPTDLYEFSYINHYKELHHRHFILIKGYNTKKKVYYILDNQHVDMGFSTKYCDFMLDYTTLYKMLTSFMQSSDPQKEYKYFWTVEPTSEFHYDALALCAQLMKKFLTDLTQHTIPKCCIEKEMIDDLIAGNFDRVIVDDIRTNCMRKVYFNSLKYFLSLVDENSPLLEQLNSNIDSVYTNWNELKNQIVYQYQKHVADTAKLEQLLNDVLVEDDNVMKQVLEFLDRADIKIEESENKPYIIKNNHNADLKITSDSIYMNLSKDKCYDTWTYNDDACQVLYPTTDSDFTLEMGLSIDGVLGGSVLGGFLFKYQYNYKIMYGNYRNIQIGLFAPNEPMTDLVKETYDVEGIRYYKVVCKNNVYDFYIRNTKSDEWRKVYTKHDENPIQYIGFFVKTWENCDIKAAFQEILYNGKPISL